jgi:ribonuclease-3
VVLDRHSYGPGAGRNKKEAEQNAAALAFAALKAAADAAQDPGDAATVDAGETPGADRTSR